MTKDKIFSKKGIEVVIVLLLFVIFTTTLVYYFNYKTKIIQNDYEAKISDLKQQVVAFDTNLSSQLGLINVNLQNFKKQNQLEINTLSQLIESIEQQSNIKLGALNDELKNIKIKNVDFSGIVDDVLQSVVSIRTDVSQGSGIIIDKKGYIITNLHVISKGSVIEAVTYSGKKYNVDTIVGYDISKDIAVLKINAQDLKSLNFGDSSKVKVGEKVIAAGNPAGLSFTVTEGIISAFRKQKDINYIQTDVPINPGNSGGPLVNSNGEVIGINNFKIGGDFEGLGFAISSNNAKEVVDRVINEYESQENL